MIVSLHPHFKGDFGLTLSLKRLFDPQTASILKNASAIVVPQSVKRREYAFCLEHTKHIFPNYACRFGFEGKAGNFLLLENLALPHPRTFLYESVADWTAQREDNPSLPLPYPFVVKNDQGGCGFGIFLVRNSRDLEGALAFLKAQDGRFVVQEYVDHGGKDLRVVLAGEQVRAYWRRQETPGEFRNNVGRGAFIDFEGDPEMTSIGVECALELKRLSGINLAAVDILFDSKDRRPLIGEINFVFGRKGVGGTAAFRKLFEMEARNWLKSLGQGYPV